MNDLMHTVTLGDGTRQANKNAASGGATDGEAASGFSLLLNGQVEQQTVQPGAKKIISKQQEDAESDDLEDDSVPFAGFVPEELLASTPQPVPAGMVRQGEAGPGEAGQEFVVVRNTFEQTPIAGQPGDHIAEIKPLAAFPLRVLPRPLSVDAESTATEGGFVGEVVSPASGSTPHAPLVVQPEMAMAQPGALDEKMMRFEELIERFDRRLLSMVQRKEMVTRITVHPASMGRLTVSCTEENSVLRVEIMAESQGVREAIAQQEDAIRRIMQEHSLELDGFDVLLDEGGGHQRRAREEREAEYSGKWCGTTPAINDDGESHAPQLRHKGGAVSLIA